MSFLNIFKSIAKKGKNDDLFKIYSDWELTQFRDQKIVQNTTVDDLISKMVLELKKENENMQIDSDLQNYSLVLVIKQSKNQQVVSKRLLYPFEYPLNIIKDTQNGEYNYYLVFKQKMGANENTVNYVRSQTQAQNQNQVTKKLTEEYVRQGYLYKLNNNGQYKEKYFILKKDQLIYSKSQKEIENNFNWIPLQFAKAEQLNNLKLIFELRLSNKKNYLLKAKNSVDITAWILAINKQAFIVTENHIIKEDYYQIKNIQKQFNNSIQYDLRNMSSNFNQLFNVNMNAEKYMFSNMLKIQFYQYLQQKQSQNLLFYCLILELNILYQYFRIKEINIQSYMIQQLMFTILQKQIDMFQKYESQNQNGQQLLQQQQQINKEEEINNHNIRSQKLSDNIVQMILAFHSSIVLDYRKDNEASLKSEEVAAKISELLKAEIELDFTERNENQIMEQLKEIFQNYQPKKMKITNNTYVKDVFKNLTRILLENINSDYKQFTTTKEFINTLDKVKFIQLQLKFRDIYSLEYFQELEKNLYKEQQAQHLICLVEYINQL